MRTIEIKRGDKWHKIAECRTNQQVLDRVKSIQSSNKMRSAELRSTTIVGDNYPTAVKYFPSVELLEKRKQEREAKRNPIDRLQALISGSKVTFHSED
jgi:hypothetical protein